MIINIAFFILQPHTGLLGYRYAHYLDRRSANGAEHVRMVRAKLMKTGESEASYSARFNAVLQNQKKSMLIFSVPVLALAMLVLFAGSGRTYVEHLVFSVHTYAFALLYVCVVAIVVSLLAIPLYNAGFSRLAGRLAGDAGITLFMLAGMTAYMHLGFRRAYGAGGIGVLIRAFALAWTIGYLTGTYRDVVFYATFRST